MIENRVNLKFVVLGRMGKELVNNLNRDSVNFSNNKVKIKLLINNLLIIYAMIWELRVLIIAKVLLNYLLDYV